MKTNKKEFYSLVKRMVKEEVDRFLKNEQGGDASAGLAAPFSTTGTTPTTTATAGVGTSDTTSGQSSLSNNQQNSADTNKKKTEDDLVNDTKELSKKTRDVPTILKGLKSSIQLNPNLDLNKVIAGLDGVNDYTVKQVSRRFKEFVAAGSNSSNQQQNNVNVAKAPTKQNN